jgi:hypothetical protein
MANGDFASHPIDRLEISSQCRFTRFDKSLT